MEDIAKTVLLNPIFLGIFLILCVLGIFAILGVIVWCLGKSGKVSRRISVDEEEEDFEREEEIEEEVKKAGIEFDRLINIKDAENWSCDDIDLRLRQQKRFGRRFNLLQSNSENHMEEEVETEEIFEFLSGVFADSISPSRFVRENLFSSVNPSADHLRDAFADAIYQLERIYSRKCTDTATPDTIIGYRNE